MRGTYDSYASIDERNRSQDRSYTEHPLSTRFWSDLESEEGNLDLHDVARMESSREHGIIMSLLVQTVSNVYVLRNKMLTKSLACLAQLFSGNKVPRSL